MSLQCYVLRFLARQCQALVSGCAAINTGALALQDAPLVADAGARQGIGRLADRLRCQASGALIRNHYREGQGRRKRRR